MATKKVVSKKPAPKKAESTKVSVEDISGCIIIYKDKRLSVDSVRIAVGATVSTGQFETARFDCSMTIRPVDQDISVEEMTEIGWDMCKSEVAQQVIATREKTRRQG